jgi:hypothetical protein
MDRNEPEGIPSINSAFALTGSDGFLSFMTPLTRPMLMTGSRAQEAGPRDLPLINIFRFSAPKPKLLARNHKTWIRLFR